MTATAFFLALAVLVMAIVVVPLALINLCIFLMEE